MRRGFSLLEILVAMLLFMLVFAAFAFVFPSGFHLNLKSYRQNQSIDLADSILQEISNKPFYAPPGDPVIGDSLNNLQGWSTATAGQAGSWTPQSLINFYNNNPQLAAEYQYAIPDKTGIQVNFIPAANPASLSNNPMANVSVTLQWREVANGGGGFIPRSITLTSYVTYNR